MPLRRASATSSHKPVKSRLFGERNEARNRPPAVGHLERLSPSNTPEQPTRLLAKLTNTIGGSPNAQNGHQHAKRAQRP